MASYASNWSPIAPSLLAYWMGASNVEFPETAHRLFDIMPQKDTLSWNTMIGGLATHGLGREAVDLFDQMQKIGDAKPDSVTLLAVLCACTHSGMVHEGMFYFNSMPSSYGVVPEVEHYGCMVDLLSRAAISCLVNFYAKLGRMDYADRFLSQTMEPDVVAWTALMTGYTRVGDINAALLTYQKMVNSHIVPTEKTISCALVAVSKLGSFLLGTQIHGYIVKRQLELDDHILSGLIDMYSICGAPSYMCRQLFDQMLVKDEVSWTSMISAYSRRREGLAVLQLFNVMQAAGVYPDSVAFTAVLSACSSSGMLQEGLSCFDMMIQDFGISQGKSMCRLM